LGQHPFGGWISKHMVYASTWKIVSVDFETDEKGDCECVIYLGF